MKRIVACVLAVPLACLAVAWAAETDKPAPTTQPVGELKTDLEKFSYFLGAGVGQFLKQREGLLATSVDFQAFLQGLRDARGDKELAFVPKNPDQAFKAFLEGQDKIIGQRNKRQQEAFLAKNKARDGVVTTDSGLQYEVLKKGDGPKPKATDAVKAHYKGTLLDGRVFDSSYQRGQPATFALRGVIPAWQEALQLMPVGSKYKLYVPAKIGYGQERKGYLIGPHAMLIFEVELLGIEPPRTTSPFPPSR